MGPHVAGKLVVRMHDRFFLVVVGICIILFGHMLTVKSGKTRKSTNKWPVNQILKIPTTTTNHPYCACLTSGLNYDACR